MNQHPSRKEIGRSVYFNWVKTDKFKHNRLSIHFITPLNISTVSNNAMVPLMLRRGSKNHLDFTYLNKELNNLYGASIGIGMSRFNAYQQLTLSIQSLDSRYTMDSENLVEKCAKLLIDLIFNPNINSNGEFDPQLLALEKQYLIDTIEGEINDKRSYSIDRTLEEMLGDNVIATPRYGTVKTTKAVTSASVKAALDKLINSAKVEIFFTGTSDPQPAIAAMEDAFGTLKRDPTDYQLAHFSSDVDKLNEVNEQLDELQQGKLVMGFRVAGLNDLSDKYAARLFSAVLGATPVSKLFVNVRERLSLCYYCSSQLDSVNRLLLIDSGVESKNKDKAYDEILSQLKLMQQGEITTEEITSSKLLLRSAITRVEDSLNAIESWFISQILQDENLSLAQDIEYMEKVTKEQIVAVAKNVALDTVYFLSGKEES